MDFAIIETGGKQYKVAAGDTLLIEKLPGEHKEGDSIIFDSVLLVGSDKDTKIGTPIVSGAKVTATFNGDGKDKKVVVQKFKSKSRYSVKRGHRQPHSSITISSIK